MPFLGYSLFSGAFAARNRLKKAGYCIAMERISDDIRNLDLPEEKKSQILSELNPSEPPSQKNWTGIKNAIVTLLRGDEKAVLIGNSILSELWMHRKLFEIRHLLEPYKVKNFNEFKWAIAFPGLCDRLLLSSTNAKAVLNLLQLRSNFPNVNIDDRKLGLDALKYAYTKTEDLELLKATKGLEGLFRRQARSFSSIYKDIF